MNNKLEVIGIDHGWSMMKTVTQVFVTGVKEITTTPALFGDVLEYDGKYYKIGTVRQEVKDTKVEDDSFYLLTLAAVAKELKKRGLSDAKVFLAVGLPLTRFGAERNNFIKYLTKNKRVDFRYENEAYHIEIDDVAVFPQCYAAVVDKIPTMAKKTLVVDIGSWTIDIMPVINKSPDESKCVTVPRGLITCMYEKYQSCGDLEETLMAACDLMAMEFAKTPQVVDVDSLYKDADEKVVFQLINTEQNKSFLEQVPHREFQDLSIIYKLVVNADTESIQSIKVTNSLAERLGMNEEQLFKYAAENTRRILPPRIRNMNDVMKEMFLSDGMPEEIAEMMIREVPPEQTLWIISNNRGIDGAVSMLYENELHELAENLESDLYILPSSVHEVLAVSTELTEPEELAQMVAEVNMQKVALEERLSNQVYHYDKDLRKAARLQD